MTKSVLDGSATGFRAMELSADCHSVLPGTDTRITVTPNREGPAVFLHEGSYYLYLYLRHEHHIDEQNLTWQLRSCVTEVGD